MKNMNDIPERKDRATQILHTVCVISGLKYHHGFTGHSDISVLHFCSLFIVDACFGNDQHNICLSLLFEKEKLMMIVLRIRTTGL